MPYQAARRIKLGDQRFEIGDLVDEDLDRDWTLLVRRGLVVKINPESRRKPAEHERKSTPPAKKPAGKSAKPSPPAGD